MNINSDTFHTCSHFTCKKGTMFKSFFFVLSMSSDVIMWGGLSLIISNT